MLLRCITSYLRQMCGVRDRTLGTGKEELYDTLRKIWIAINRLSDVKCLGVSVEMLKIKKSTSR
jgi:hypothetical protein